MQSLTGASRLSTYNIFDAPLVMRAVREADNRLDERGSKLAILLARETVIGLYHSSRFGQLSCTKKANIGNLKFFRR